MKLFLLIWFVLEGCLSVTSEYVSLFQQGLSYIQLRTHADSLTSSLDLYQSLFHSTTSEVLANFMNYKDQFASKVSDKCWNDTQLILAGVMSNKPWAMKFLDALGRPEAGLSNGAFFWLGDYDTCMSQLYNADASFTNVTGHYCIASGPVIVSSFSVLTINEGLCAPRSCSGEDVKQLVNEGIQYLAQWAPQFKSLQVSTAVCKVRQDDLTLPSATIAAIAVLGVLGFVVLLATIYHQHYNWTEDGTISHLIQFLQKFFSCCGTRNESNGCCTAWRQRVFINFVDEAQFNSSDEDTDPMVINSRHGIQVAASYQSQASMRVMGPFGDGQPPSLVNAGRVSPSMFLANEIRNSPNGHNQSRSFVVKPQTSCKDRLHEIILAFSLIQNVMKLMAGCFMPSRKSCEKKDVNSKPSLDSKPVKMPVSKDADLSCLHGIRFISLTWVILGHTFAFGNGAINNTISFTDTLIHWAHFHAIFNATFSVDTFFLLSGLLTSYLFYRAALEKGSPFRINWILFYVHRYWRLTPPYLLLLFLETNLFGYLRDGPIYPQVTGIEASCNESWWTNLLYINNVVMVNRTCMGWSWYLANDMQFYVFSPILLIPLFYSSIAGVIIALLGIAGSVTATGIISYQNNLQAGTLSLLQEGFHLIYIKPWCRISPYLVGILVGHLLAKSRGQLHFHRLLQILLWVASGAMCCSIVYGLYDPDTGVAILSVDLAAFYNSVSRFGWSLGVGWVIVACVCGMGGWVNRLLSWSAFVPLSRLSYCAYLVHPLVLFFIYYSQMTVIKVTVISMVVFYISGLTLSYTLAFLLSMIAEAPAMGLEKSLLSTKR